MKKHNNKPSSIRHTLNLGWLYPDLMSTYGDRGNVIVLQQRCKLRNITLNVFPITRDTTVKEMDKVDIFFGGGSQDREQEIVMRDLRGKKGDMVKKKIDKNTPALFVCGSPQLMGTYYEPGKGERIEGLGIFDMTSIHPGLDKPRLIGNVVGEVLWEHLGVQNPNKELPYIVGFENHGGRTFLGTSVKPFAKVLSGNGNNGEDGTEGVVYKNAIGCYFHGPLLPKNPHIADVLIQKTVEVKYDESITLDLLDDTLEIQANHAIVNRLGIKI